MRSTDARGILRFDVSHVHSAWSGISTSTENFFLQHASIFSSTQPDRGTHK